MVRAPLVLAGLLGHSLLPCEGISAHPRDVWKKLTLLQVPEQSEQCGDAQPGDKCHGLVTWSLDSGLTEHPEWFVTFEKSVSKERNFRAMQEILYSKGKAGCSKPCPTAAPFSKAQKRTAAQLARAAKAEKEAAEKAEAEAEAGAQAKKEAEERAREAREAGARAEEGVKEEALGLAKDAEDQARKDAQTQADIDKAKAELRALDAPTRPPRTAWTAPESASGTDGSDAPSLEALKAEKRHHLESLQAHLRVETNQEVAKQEAAERAMNAAEELVRKDAEAEAQAQKEAAEKAGELSRRNAESEDQELKEADEEEWRKWAANTNPIQTESLEDMSPEKLKEYLDHPGKFEHYANYLN